jgi:small subunit ribosomal protein S4e
MGKRHLKRLAAPREWKVARKVAKWITKPLPGPHPKEACLPLLVIVRDMLGLGRNAREAKRIISGGEIKVDQRVRKEHKFPVGLMDVITIERKGMNFRVWLGKGGRMELLEISKREAGVKLCRVERKNYVKGRKVQVGLHDGKNILLSEKDGKVIKIGDSLLISLPEQKIKKQIKLEKGCWVLVIKGVHAGEIAKVQDFKRVEGSPEKIVLKKGKEKFETLRKYALVIGKEKPEVKVS